jgi:hypothetical protein
VVTCLGIGFLAIYVVSALLRLPQHHWWPLVPGGILAVVGVLLLSGAYVGDALRWWPVVLVVVGALLIGQALLRARR